MQQPEEGRRGALVELGRYSGHGLTLGLSTALFAWLGTLVDERLHTEPLFVLLGTFAGFGAGFYAMYRQLVVEPRRRAEEERADRERVGGD
ncbi:MAG: AtpZ/AtpI family protein [Gemmatimonadota bacterium]